MSIQPWRSRYKPCDRDHPYFQLLESDVVSEKVIQQSIESFIEKIHGDFEPLVVWRSGGTFPKRLEFYCKNSCCFFKVSQLSPDQVNWDLVLITPNIKSAIDSYNSLYENF